MVTVFPRGADSCSQLTSNSYEVIRQTETSAGEAQVPTSSMAVQHRHRDLHLHRHHHGSDETGFLQSVMDLHHSGQTSDPPANERKMRREIANHNERKRMQSINAGFQSLRTLLPRSGSTSSADRLSKAAILQQAVDYISYLMDERQHLIELNRQCMAAKVGTTMGVMEDGSHGRRCPSSPIPLIKRHKSSDCDESSDDSSKVTKAEVAASHPEMSSLMIPATVIRDRLKQRLPSQEATVDCGNAEQVAQSLQQGNILLKDETAVSSSDDQRVMSHDYVSSSYSPRTCLSISRRNLETIVEAIRHLEGESFYSDELSSVQSGAESDRDSDRDDMLPLYNATIQPYALLTADTATSCSVQNSRMALLRAELFQPLSSVKKC